MSRSKYVDWIVETFDLLVTLAYAAGYISSTLWFRLTLPINAVFFVWLAADAYRRDAKPLAFLYGLLIFVFIVIALVMGGPF